MQSVQIWISADESSHRVLTRLLRALRACDPTTESKGFIFKSVCFQIFERTRIPLGLLKQFDLQRFGGISELIFIFCRTVRMRYTVNALPTVLQ